MTGQQKVLLVTVGALALTIAFMAGWFVGQQQAAQPDNTIEATTQSETLSTESTNEKVTNNTQSSKPTDSTKGLVFTLINNGTAYEVSGYTGSNSDVTIPSTYKSKPVTRIGDSAFSGNTKLETVSLPDSITEIGEFAFYHCYNLTSIVIPHPVKSIETGSFDGCFRLTSVTLYYGIESIGKDAFSSCFDLSSFTIPGSVTLIDSSAFSGCNDLTKLSFNGTVEQWEAMERKLGWNLMVPATKVICLDGTVPLK